MKFKLAKSYRYWWPVTIRQPDPDNAGKLVEMKLKLLFEPSNREEVLESQKRFSELASEAERMEHETAQYLRVVKGWDDVVDEDDGQQVPFSEELFRQALSHSWFRAGVERAYVESLLGEEARLGN
ncbi:MAG TPA: hypothetical protein DEB47_04870 [Citreicella sp.]|nr:hypothetical protein [Citreicella sp.]